MKKLLIFGYSGFVGPYLAKEFADNGYAVYGCDINESLNNDKTTFFKCDILNFKEVDDVVSRVLPDVIVNLAAISSVGQSWKNPQLTFQVNVSGALNILESSKKVSKKPKILFIGSSEEYVSCEYPVSEIDQLNANNPYGISKIAQEQLAALYREQYSLNIYCVRSFNHIGVGQRDTFVIPSWCRQVAEIEKGISDSNTVKVGNINIYRDFTDVRDVVKAYRLIVESNNSASLYNVGSGNAYLLKDLLSIIVSFSSKRIDVVVESNYLRPNDNGYICCNRSKITNELGWEPKHDIRDTLKEIYDSFMK